jgi:hypothetical protein
MCLWGVAVGAAMVAVGLGTLATAIVVGLGGTGGGGRVTLLPGERTVLVGLLRCRIWVPAGLGTDGTAVADGIGVAVAEGFATCATLDRVAPW